MDLKSLFMGVAFAAMWSSAFTSARIIVSSAPPMASLSIRFLISGLIGIGIAVAIGQVGRLDRRQWANIAVFGLCQNALYLGLNFIAMQRVEAGLAAIIASALPLFVAFANWTMFGERLSTAGIAGIAAGMAGVTLIMGARLSGGGVPVGGLALCVVGVIALTVATLSVKGASSGGNLLMVVSLQMFVGAAILFVPAALFETWTFTPSWELAAAFAYTTLVPGLLATWVWFALVERIGATRAATYHFLNPFFGVAVAAVVLGETLSTRDLIGVAVIMAGILAVQTARRG